MYYNENFDMFQIYFHAIFYMSKFIGHYIESEILGAEQVGLQVINILDLLLGGALFES
jgi:hypothetical protein